MIIGLDCDEVLRPFVDALTDRYKKEHPDHAVKPVVQYDLSESFPVGKDIWRWTYSKGVIEDIFLGAGVVPGAREFLTQLRSSGHRVHIVTSQPRQFECDPAPLTLAWFKRHELPWDDFSFCREKWRIECDILVDDCTDHLVAQYQHGKRAVAMDRPWNKEWNGDRIYTLDELYKYLEK